MPDLRNTDGDELLQCTVSYPLAEGTADDDVRAALGSCADLRPASATLWNWVRLEKTRHSIGRPNRNIEIADHRDISR